MKKNAASILFAKLMFAGHLMGVMSCSSPSIERRSDTLEGYKFPGYAIVSGEALKLQQTTVGGREAEEVFIDIDEILWLDKLYFTETKVGEYKITNIPNDPVSRRIHSPEIKIGSIQAGRKYYYVFQGIAYKGPILHDVFEHHDDAKQATSIRAK